MSDQENAFQDRRRSRRYAYDGPITMCPPGGTPIAGQIVDLSVDGCLLRVLESNSFQKDSVATVTFQSDRLTVQRSGVVKRCDEQQGLLGISFLQPGESVSLEGTQLPLPIRR